MPILLGFRLAKISLFFHFPKLSTIPESFILIGPAILEEIFPKQDLPPPWSPYRTGAICSEKDCCNLIYTSGGYSGMKGYVRVLF